MKKYLFSFFCLTVLGIANAQYQPYERDWGAWYMTFTRTRFSDKFSYHAEAQHRLHTPFDRKQQLLLRTALNYHIHPRVMLSIGYGNITSWFYLTDEAADTLPTRLKENRIYQQLILKDRIGRFYFQHRFRVEQRSLSFGDRSWFAHRGRYFFNVNIPINHKEMTDKTVFYSFYDEIFINIDPENPFGQNRFFHAIGYKFNQTLNIRAGYLYNFAGVNYNRWQIGAWISPDLRKTGSE